MAVTPTNPHDEYFRQVLGEPANAASQLRTLLPEAVVAQLDWDRLELTTSSFISAELCSSYSDLLFRTSVDGHDAFIYILVGHQSCSDRMMPLRMLGYVARIWTDHVGENPGTRRLPVVIPVLVHSNHNSVAWSAPTELADLYDADPSTLQTLGPYLPRFHFFLDDIAGSDAEALRTRQLTPPVRLMLHLHKIGPKFTAIDFAAMADRSASKPRMR
ncbi:Rpn family recombination-promoting nuclease/putative transposase [Nocardia sp. NPDC050712]|uniref:Rpn family recombination-promoting nuclease/putative transposase n=1 Tax=Nocardia sp. NPDC050712 TaxID=3155518 RepID=UPI0033E57B95